MDVGVLLDQGPSLVLGWSESKGKNKLHLNLSSKKKSQSVYFPNKKGSSISLQCFSPRDCCFYLLMFVLFNCAEVYNASAKYCTGACMCLQVTFCLSSLQAHHTVWRKLRQRAEKLVRRTNASVSHSTAVTSKLKL